MANNAYFRLRMLDLNGQWGGVCVPMPDDFYQDAVVDLSELYGACTSTGQRYAETVRRNGRWNNEGVTGPTPLIADVAVLVFASEGPFGLKVPILGPAEIFKPDDITVDESQADVAVLIAWLLLYAQDRAGYALTNYLSGRRVGAGGP